MLKSKAIQRIQARLGFRTDLEATILAELQDSQNKLEQGVPLPTGGTFLPWFLQTEIGSVLTDIGEERIPLPTDPKFLKEAEGDALWYFNDAATEPEDIWTPLHKDDLDFLRTNLTGTGAPKAYALDGTYFRILPTPDQVYKLKMLYFGADAPLTEEDTENKWLQFAPYLLIGDAGREVAFSARDDKAAQFFEQTFQREVQRVWAMGEAREHENRSYVMGGDS